MSEERGLPQWRVTLERINRLVGAQPPVTSHAVSVVQEILKRELEAAWNEERGTLSLDGYVRVRALQHVIAIAQPKE